MQLRKTFWMLTALSAMSLVMTGCPEDGGGSVTCSSDTDCLESEICHPTAKACVTTCTSSADCPDSAKTCAAVTTGSTTQVCQCSTDALCNTDRAEADLVCSTLDKVCAPKCAADLDCGTGRTCDTATGQCKAGPTGVDCTFGSCTAANQVCNSTTNKCEAAATCTGTAQGTCAYGQFCNGTTCAQPAKPTCSNLASKPAASFTPASGTGYIVYGVEKREFGGTTGCGTGTQRVIPRISFYTKDGTLPAGEEGLNGGFYVTVNGNEIGLVPANMLNYTRAADGKSATVDVFLCADDAISSINLAFFFTGGNGFCSTLTK
jgi:hypothetical protein